jgi:hypothetical protein
MSLLSDEMARASAELQSLITTADGAISSITWKGGDYLAIVIWNEMAYMNAGGMIPMDDLTAQILEVEFGLPDGPFPQLKDIFTYRGRQFRIEIIQHAPGGYLKYTCADPSKGA